MAFFSKSVNILKQTVSKHVNSDICGSNSSMLQIVRWMSSSKLFVGGISYSTDDTSLREAFNKYGDVIEARIIMDRETGRSRGFGFVTFTSGEEASAAIQALDGQDLHGRRIRVNYANDRPPRTGGYGGSGFGGGGYGGGGFGGGAGGGYGGGGYGGNDYGSGGGSGGNNYGSVGSNFGQGSNYDSGIGYSSGSSGGQSFGVAGGGGSGGGSGGDSFGQNFSQGGFDSGSSGNYGSFGVAGGVGGSDNFASGGSSGSNIDDASGDFGQDQEDNDGGFGQDEPLEGNYRDDDNDEPDDYANKRA